jgi:lysozyme
MKPSDFSTAQVELVQNYLNNTNGAGLGVDGDPGDETCGAAINYALGLAMKQSAPTIINTAPAPINNTVVSIPPKPLSSSRLKGFDGYSGDEISSFQDMFNGGVVWTYLKATQGLDYKDSAFPKNLSLAKASGLICGSYHFVNLAEDPIAQASQFVSYSVSSGIGAKDFMVLDYETTDGDPYSAAGDLIWIKSFLETVKTQAKKRCWIYCGEYIMQELIGDNSFLLEYPVILANYNPESQIAPPPPWSAWNAWQTSGSGRIPGVSNLGDTDLFQGDINDLQALISYCNV